jgi:beta-glucosidase
MGTVGIRGKAGRLVAGCTVALAALAGLAAPGVASPTPARAAGRPWLVAGQTPQQRADELLAQMTLDEKIAMVHGDTWPPTGPFAGHVPGNARLGIPELFLSDGPNGVGNGSTGVTAFPVAVTDAATWDRGLVEDYGAALGAEHAGKGHNVALSPTLNLLRTPLWGRESETFTEDPYLNGQTAAAEIRGTQSQHVIATPKHYAANNQESGRLGVPLGGTAVNELISDRTLQELYLPGFRTAVQEGGAGAVMCAYQQVNGDYACQNPDLLNTLTSDWGFDGFVVSDWVFATRDAVLAANAGMDMEMPLGTHFGDALKAAVQSGKVPMARLDDMVRRILVAMFRVGLFDHPVGGDPSAVVSTPAHVALARTIAEQGSVLLKDAGGVLPLDARRDASIAVIGADAGAAAQVVEGGSGATTVAGLVTPIDGITARAGAGVDVTYAPGTLGTAPLPVLSGSVLAPTSGTGPGLLATYYATPDWSGTPVATHVDPSIDFATAPVPGLPTVWSARWTGTLTAEATGDYRFSVNGGGAFRLAIGGRQVADVPYADFPTTAHAFVHLRAGVPVTISLEYSTAVSIFGASVHLGWQPPDPAMLDEAIAAARASDVAVVFVNDTTGEGADRTGLGLPGDQDRLISAVAAVNPRTVVVLNTGGPVLMPWLHRVAGVIEAWYPGQEDGNAIAAVLFGDVNPSGKLPMTFPASERQGPASDPAGLSLDTERYSEGLLVGYRWFDATGQRPLFPFGHGLSYTTFGYDRLRVSPGPGAGATVSVRVTNTGHRAGAEVVQLYVGDPPAAGEPPKQLKGYQKVTLRPGQHRTVTFRLAAADLAVWSEAQGRSVVVPGTYSVLVGSSSRAIRASGSVRIG